MENVFREIKTKEEAKMFQDYYKDYCERYNNKKTIMDAYKYRVPELKSCMEEYLGNGFVEINKYMRSEKEKNERLDFMIDLINEVILCAPRIPEDIIVYRGVSERTMKHIKDEIKEYGGYKEKAFMSTSLRLETVKKEFPNNKYILKINVPKGSIALCVDHIVDRTEEEVLFFQNQSMKYIGKEVDKSTNKEIYEFSIVFHNMVENYSPD